MAGLLRMPASCHCRAMARRSPALELEEAAEESDAKAGIDHGRHIGAACHSRNGEEGRLRSLMTRPSLTNRSAVRLGQLPKVRCPRIVV